MIRASLARLALCALALCALATPSRAADQVACQDANGSPWTASPQHPCATGIGLLVPVAGSQEALGVVAATALTPPVGSTIATITVEGQSVRYRCDGTNPTAASGSLLVVTSTQLPFVLAVNPLTACKFIQTAATATLDVEYYHQ